MPLHLYDDKRLLYLIDKASKCLIDEGASKEKIDAFNEKITEWENRVNDLYEKALSGYLAYKDQCKWILSWDNYWQEFINNKIHLVSDLVVPKEWFAIVVVDFGDTIVTNPTVKVTYVRKDERVHYTRAFNNAMPLVFAFFVKLWENT